ncbi:MAG TPA: AI-2E family transporter [Cytophagales bacterium]|nr:AI-2E family transporter [Cytophagales bacterium]
MDNGFDKNKFAQKVLITLGIVLPILLLILFFGFAFQVLLLVMAGVLVAVFFRGIAAFIHSRLHLGMKWSLGISILGVMIVIGLAALFIAPSVSDQAQKLSQEIPKSVEKLKQQAKGNKAFEDVLSGSFDPQSFMKKQGGWAKKAFGALTTTLGVLADIYVIFFIGLFFTVSPNPLINGIVSLFPLSRRDRAREVLGAIGKSLKKWLMAKLLSMTVVGVLTTIGLSILGIPLAFVLGLIAGLLSFIPNFGPIIALIPAILVAFSQGANQALYVALLYIGIQALESNFITPFIQKNMVSIPMALILIAQIVLGVFSSGLGLILATPIAVTFIVLVKMVYVQDVLGDQSAKD